MVVLKRTTQHYFFHFFPAHNFHAPIEFDSIFPLLPISAGDDVTAAALAAKAEDDPQSNQAKKNEQRRKRYREKTLEEEAEDNKPAKTSQSHEDQLASRRLKDRQRYASMTPEQRQIYNAKRREQVCMTTTSFLARMLEGHKF